MALNNNAININAGFEIGSSQPIDSRQLLTKAQMLSIDDNIMPSKYFCICSDDGLLYTYDANNEVDEELGKFRVASGLEVIRLTQAKYNQMVEDGKIEDKFYLITDAPNPSIGDASNVLEIAYDNTNSGLAAVNVQDAIDEVNEKTDAKLDKVESIPTTPSNDDTVLFLGTTTNDYTKGHIYQYQTNKWVDLSPEEGIDEEARETATGAMALATTANEKVESISQDASGISYNNTTSGLTAENVQNAIDEVNVKVDNIPKAVVPKGTVAFANLPELTNVEVGWMYNINDDFTTTSNFITSGTSEKAGSNVYCIEVSGTKKWDVFAASEDGINIYKCNSIEEYEALTEEEKEKYDYISIPDGSNTKIQKIILTNVTISAGASYLVRLTDYDIDTGSGEPWSAFIYNRSNFTQLYIYGGGDNILYIVNNDASEITGDIYIAITTKI